MKKLDVNFIYSWLVKTAVFLALSGLFLAYYRKMDYWLYTTTGNVYYKAEGLFVQGYGAVHIPTLILAFEIALAAIITPLIAALIMKAADTVMTRPEPPVAASVANEEDDWFVDFETAGEESA